MVTLVKHGFEKPIATDLEEYQLGWSIDESCLYIKDKNGEIKEVLSNKFVERVVESFMETDTFKNKLDRIIRQINIGDNQ